MISRKITSVRERNRNDSKDRGKEIPLTGRGKFSEISGIQSGYAEFEMSTIYPERDVEQAVR